MNTDGFRKLYFLAVALLVLATRAFAQQPASDTTNPFYRQLAEDVQSMKGWGNKAEKPQPVDTSDVYSYPDLMPAFNGDITRWLAQNLNFSGKSDSGNDPGKVIVYFIIDEYGKPIYPMIASGSGNDDFDREAIRVVTAMPNWRSGSLHNGRKVKVRYRLPIQCCFRN